MRSRITLALIVLSPFLIGGFALFWGAYAVSPVTVLKVLGSKLALSGAEQIAECAIVWDIRLPRIVMAGFIGAALSVSGVTLQGIFRNPLVDPFILGVSAGAAFGCALSVVAFPHLPIQLGAFVFSLLGCFVTYCLARNQGEVPRLALVLSGVVVSAFFSALVSILKFVADPHKLVSIVYWLMGSFSLSDWPSVSIAAIGITGACIPIVLMRWRLNALSMGDEEAASLGAAVERDRLAFIAASSLAVGCAVSLSGIIGWVGLMVPHTVRMLTGPDHRILAPLCIPAGAAFMIFADTLARNLTSFDVPVGIITALSGAPFFIYLMKTGARESWGK